MIHRRHRERCHCEADATLSPTRARSPHLARLHQQKGEPTAGRRSQSLADQYKDHFWTPMWLGISSNSYLSKHSVSFLAQSSHCIFFYLLFVSSPFFILVVKLSLGATISATWPRGSKPREGVASWLHVLLLPSGLLGQRHHQGAPLGLNTSTRTADS